MFRSTIVVYQIGHGRLVLWRFLPLEGTRAERISSRSWTQNDRKESRVGGTCIRRKPDGSRHEKEFDIGKGETQTRLFSIAKNKWWHNTRSSVLERVGVGAVWHNAVAPSMYFDIAEYLSSAPHSSNCDLKKRLMTDYKEGEAYSYFDSKFLKEVKYHPISKESPFCILSAYCTLSQKINSTFHTAWACYIKKTGYICRAYCTCFAG